MKQKFKNIEINSQILNELKEKASKTQDIKHLKKDILKQNSLLNYIEVFEKSPLFETKVLNRGELLFDEGDLDNNLYIIKSGILRVEKYTSLNKDFSKQLAILKTGDFLGEGSLDKKNSKKEVLVKALEKSEVLSIDGKNDLKKFIEENPSIGFELLKHIIIETNKRLLESNRLIVSNYEIDTCINNLKKIDIKSIFNLIDQIKLIALVDYILFFEKHQAIENLLVLKYDSRQPNKMQDLVFERVGYFLNLDELFEKCNIKKEDYILINKLSIGQEIFGYLIFGREKRIFNSSDKKIFSSISNSLSGVIKKFITDKENYNKLYITEMKK